MKRSIINAFEEMENRLSRVVAAASYQYMNQCVKAEEASLLSVTCNIEGVEKYLEEVAKVVKPDTYTFAVIPNYEEDMQTIIDGITEQHSEFTMEECSEDVDVSNGQKDQEPEHVAVKYLKLTMPDVDDDRKKTLNSEVKKIYEQCKEDMYKIYVATQMQLNKLLDGEPERVQNEVADSFTTIKNKWEEHREKIYETKLEEIKEGYSKWQYEQQVKERQEEEQAKEEAKEEVEEEVKEEVKAEVVQEEQVQEEENKGCYYKIGDIIKYQGYLYVCVSDHKIDGTATFVTLNGEESHETTKFKWKGVGEDVVYSDDMASVETLKDWIGNVLFKADTASAMREHLNAKGIAEEKWNQVVPQNETMRFWIAYMLTDEWRLWCDPTEVKVQNERGVNIRCGAVQAQMSSDVLRNFKDVDINRDRPKEWQKVKNKERNIVHLRVRPFGVMLTDKLIKKDTIKKGTFTSSTESEYWVPYIFLLSDSHYQSNEEEGRRQNTRASGAAQKMNNRPIAGARPQR